jgi:hypothetical protein
VNYIDHQLSQYQSRRWRQGIVKPDASTVREETPDMAMRIVTVLGASRTLGSEIFRALLEKGARVRAMVRSASDRTKLESLGVTEFLVADLMDAASLERARTVEPRAEAVVANFLTLKFNLPG